jgi:hypothetical protein
MHILVLALATWRIASLLASEPGPWDGLGRLRKLAGVRYDEEGRPYGTNEVSKAMICVWCSSVWIGAGWMAFYWLRSDYAFWAALPFALSAGAVIVGEVVEWLEHRP